MARPGFACVSLLPSPSHPFPLSPLSWASSFLPASFTHTLTPTQYNDNVIGSGANYNDAYFEIKNIRAYTTGGVVPTPTANYQGTIPTITGTSALQSSTSTVGTALIPTPWYYPGAAVSDVRVGMGRVMGAVGVIVVLSGFLL